MTMTNMLAEGISSFGLGALVLLMIGSGAATIIPLERYVIDTGAYVLYEPSVQYQTIIDPAVLAKLNVTSIEGITYPDLDNAPCISIAIVELNGSLDLSRFNHFNAVKVNKPYPGCVFSEDGWVHYVGELADKIEVSAATNQINMAGFLFENLRVYPKSQENALVANAVASELRAGAALKEESAPELTWTPIKLISDEEKERMMDQAEASFREDFPYMPDPSVNAT